MNHEMITIDEANALWDDARGLFVALEKQIQLIVEKRAWEPLGYATFSAAWADKMKGVRLATEAERCGVIYAMISDGLTDEEIERELDGRVTAKAAKVARAHHAKGTPSNIATTKEYKVREHSRKKPSAPQTVHVKLSPEEYATAKVVAQRYNMSIEEFARRALEQIIEINTMRKAA